MHKIGMMTLITNQYFNKLPQVPENNVGEKRKGGTVVSVHPKYIYIYDVLYLLNNIYNFKLYK